jgi:integrase/recombinase XerD
MKQYSGDYLHFLALEKNASRNTIASYRLDIDRYIRFLEGHGITHPDRISEGLVTGFLSTLRAAHLSPRSVTRCISSLNGFHKFLLGEGITIKNPMEGIDVPKLQRTLPDVLSQAEVELILNHFDKEPAPASDRTRRLIIRDRTILEVLYATGMRVSELIILKQHDVMETQGIVRVFGKGSKERLVPIGKSALRWIDRYKKECGTGYALFERAGKGDDADGHLEDRAGLHTESRDCQRGPSPYIPAFVCNAPPRGGGRPSGRPGDARPFRHLDDADLHAHRP